jgi:glutamine synthetase
MVKNYTELQDYLKTNKVAMVDLKFTDLFGKLRHLTLPVSQVNEVLFRDGEGFDASNFMGFKSVESGDMVIIPDVSTVNMDPFWEVPTASLLCSVNEADTKAPIMKDPRGIAARALKFMKDSGIADESLWGPEFEFYIFDSISYNNDINAAGYMIDSHEADWNSGYSDGFNMGHKIPHHGGYHAAPPLDDLHDDRSHMVQLIEAAGIPVRYHHHEVGGPGQSEIEINLQPLQKVGDVSTWVKYLIKMVAKQRNRTVTFMPKPLYNEAGNGMHFHQMLRKGGKPLFYDKNGYAGLSELALHYVGGILKHGASLLALTNPSTNSYKRLIPGFEAPVNAFFSLANRSAAIRVPKYCTTPETKRIEFRPPDATCNMYLAVAAQLMAGLDGIINKIDPTKEGFGPFDQNVFAMSEEEKKKIKPLPTSLKESCDALAADHDYLLKGEVFNDDILQTITAQKLEKEYNEVRNRPHPYELALYYDV